MPMVEREDGGQIYHFGNLHWTWDAGADALLRMIAVKLMGHERRAGCRDRGEFVLAEDALWWRHSTLYGEVFTALASNKRGPRDGSKLTAEVINQIHELKRAGLRALDIG